MPKKSRVRKCRFVYECINCGQEELDERDTIGTDRTEVIRLVRCAKCTKASVPLDKTHVAPSANDL